MERKKAPQEMSPWPNPGNPLLFSSFLLWLEDREPRSREPEGPENPRTREPEDHPGTLETPRIPRIQRTREPRTTALLWRIQLKQHDAFDHFHSHWSIFRYTNAYWLISFRIIFRIQETRKPLQKVGRFSGYSSTGSPSPSLIERWKRVFGNSRSQPNRGAQTFTSVATPRPDSPPCGTAKASGSVKTQGRPCRIMCTLWRLHA